MASRVSAKKTTKKRAKKTPAKKKVVAKKKIVAKKAVAKKAVVAGTPLAQLRKICLSLPEATEVHAWGEPTFRVRNKLFAMPSSANTHHGGGREGVWIHASHVTQDLLLRAKPNHYFRPPYVGVNGWVGAWIDGRPDWSEIAELLRDGYRERAGKRLAARLDDDE
jgi:hypothetical protein